MNQMMNDMINGVHVHERTIDYYGKVLPEMQIVSIDNRADADRSRNLDLSKTIKDSDFEYLNSADFVTDFGTIEHVKDLYYALKNVFNILKTGAKVLHSNPKIGHFPNHNDFHKFSTKFWEVYSELAGFKILEIGEQAAYHNEKTGMEVFVVMEKQEGAKFPAKKDFDHIYKKYIKKA